MDYKQEYNNVMDNIREIYYKADPATKDLIEAKFPGLKESEDERIIKSLVTALKTNFRGSTTIGGICKPKAIEWLERQKAKAEYNRMAPIYENKEAFESALQKAWTFYNESGSSTVDGCEDNTIELSFAKGFREGFIFGRTEEELNDNDKQFLLVCKNALYQYCFKEHWSYETLSKWLEEKIVSKPKNQWAPSEEQLEMLKMAAKHFGSPDDWEPTLESLYDELKHFN